MNSQAVGMSNMTLPLPLLLCLWEKWGRRHTVERRWSVSCPWGTPSETEHVCGEALLWRVVQALQATCSETAPHRALPHLYNIWHCTFATSPYTCFLTIVHSVTGTVPPPPNRGSFPFTKAHCHGCRFLLLISGVMSICTALPEMCCCLCSTGRELSLPSPMTSAASHCTFFRDYLFSCSLCSLQSVSNMSQSKNTRGASPRHISNFSSFHLLWPFPWCSQNLRKSHDNMGKKPSSAPCTYVGFLLCGTQVQLDVLQPLIFFNQKKEGGWGRRIWACFHACSNS